VVGVRIIQILGTDVKLRYECTQEQMRTSYSSVSLRYIFCRNGEIEKILCSRLHV